MIVVDVALVEVTLVDVTDVVTVAVVCVTVDVVSQPAPRLIHAEHSVAQPRVASMMAISQGFACTALDLWLYIHLTPASQFSLPESAHWLWHARTAGHELVVVEVLDVEVAEVVKVLVPVEVRVEVVHVVEVSVLDLVELVVVKVVVCVAVEVRVSVCVTGHNLPLCLQHHDFRCGIQACSHGL